MNKYKVLAAFSIIGNFLILCALEGEAVTPLIAAVLIIPMEALMIWSFDRAGFIDTEAVEADRQAMKAALKMQWISHRNYYGGEKSEH